MANEELEEVRSRLLGRERDGRLEAVEELDNLPGASARALLREGMKHWDRDLRRVCAKKLFDLLGSRGTKEILAAHAAERLSPRATAWILSTAPSQRLIDQAVKEAADRTHPVFTPFLARLEDHPRVLYWRQRAEIAKRKALVDRERQLEAKRQQEAKEHEAQQVQAVAKQKAELDQLDFDGLSRVFSPRGEFLSATFGEWRRDHDCFAGQYRSLQIPKRSGGVRELSAPAPRLKLLQRLFLDGYLTGLPLHDACHGFRVGRSTRSGAAPHVGHSVVINLDLRDFFPSVTAGRVAGLLDQLVAPGGVVGRAFLVDLVTCEGRLPQGAPTSPAIANLICRRMDSRLSGLLSKAGGVYTRYADDLTFSGDLTLLTCLPKVRAIIEEEGFGIATEKTKILRRGVRQDVTGLPVNDRVSVPRAIRRRLRAAAHAVSRGRSATWRGQEMTISSLRGHIAYVRALHPEEAARLSAKLQTSGAGTADTT